MTDKDLNAVIGRLEKQFTAMGTIDQRFMAGYDAIVRKYKNLKRTNASPEMLPGLEYCLQILSIPVNTLRRSQKEFEKLKREQEDREHSAALRARQVNYNFKCSYFALRGGEPECDIDCDIMHCGNRCPYATNMPGSLRVNGWGRVIR